MTDDDDDDDDNESLEQRWLPEQASQPTSAAAPSLRYVETSLDDLSWSSDPETRELG